MNIQRHYEMPDDGTEADEAIWFATSQKAALDMAQESARKSKQSDRIVHWMFAALAMVAGIAAAVFW